MASLLAFLDASLVLAFVRRTLQEIARNLASGGGMDKRIWDGAYSHGNHRGGSLATLLLG